MAVWSGREAGDSESEVERDPPAARHWRTASRSPAPRCGDARVARGAGAGARAPPPALGSIPEAAGDAAAVGASRRPGGGLAANHQARGPSRARDPLLAARAPRAKGAPGVAPASPGRRSGGVPGPGCARAQGRPSTEVSRLHETADTRPTNSSKEFLLLSSRERIISRPRSGRGRARPRAARRGVRGPPREGRGGSRVWAARCAGSIALPGRSESPVVLSSRRLDGRLDAATGERGKFSDAVKIALRLCPLDEKKVAAAWAEVKADDGRRQTRA